MSAKAHSFQNMSYIVIDVIWKSMQDVKPFCVSSVFGDVVYHISTHSQNFNRIILICAFKFLHREFNNKFKFFRYESLLKQSRVENENEIRKRQEEIVTLKTTIKNQGLP